MRTKIVVVLFAVMFLAGNVFAGGNANKVEKKAYNVVLSWLGELDPGISTSSGKMVHIRGARYFWLAEASDIRLTGYAGSVFNGNLDASGTGPIWGENYSTDENGSPTTDGWKCLWHGKMYDYSAGKFNWLVMSVCHGTGIYDGLRYEDTQAFDTYLYPSLYPFKGYSVGEISEAK
jgi:hypothetical protein